MAEGARRVLGADVGLAVTGVAGPDRAGRRSRWARCSSGCASTATRSSRRSSRLPGDRERVRQFATISRSTCCAAACSPSSAPAEPTRAVR